MAEEKHKIIKAAKEEVEEILSDAVIREINEFKQTAIWEENSAKRYAREQGLKEGRRLGKKIGIREGIREGIKEGIKQGIQQGIQQGINKGAKEKQIEIAKKMLKNGMKLEQIQEMTELTKEEIENLI